MIHITYIRGVCVRVRVHDTYTSVTISFLTVESC